jgi:hypothetical protein
MKSTDKIRIIDDRIATLNEWNEACNECEYSTYFHTPQWVDIFSSYTHGRLKPYPKKITFSDNCSVIISLSKISHLKGCYSTYISSPAGTFGGWISKDKLNSDHAGALTGYMLKFSNITWRENPYTPCLKDIAIPGSIQDFTQTIDLSLSMEDIEKSASRAHVKALNKATREGVFIREAQSIADWQEHFRNYELSVERWKKSGTAKKMVKPYTWAIFKNIMDKDPGHCKLWCAIYKNKIAASVLCFYWNRHAVAWHGSALDECFGVRPNNLLYQHMIVNAKENNYGWFDCNTPGGLKGVVEFKDHLGAMRLTSRFVDKTSISRKCARAIKKIF